MSPPPPQRPLGEPDFELGSTFPSWSVPGCHRLNPDELRHDAEQEKVDCGSAAPKDDLLGRVHASRASQA